MKAFGKSSRGKKALGSLCSQFCEDRFCCSRGEVDPPLRRIYSPHTDIVVLSLKVSVRGNGQDVHLIPLTLNRER